MDYNVLVQVLWTVTPGLTGHSVVYELDVCEGEVAEFPVQFPLPLAIHIHLYHLDDVPLLEFERGLVVRVGHTGLPHPRQRRQRPLHIGVLLVVGRAGRVAELTLGFRRRERHTGRVQQPLYVGYWYGAGAALAVARRPPLVLISVDHHQTLAAAERQIVRVVAIKVEFGYDELEHLERVRRWSGSASRRLRQRSHQRRRVQVVVPVERQQRRHVREHLVPDPVPGHAVVGRDPVDYVVGHAAVLSDTQHIIALYCLGVSHEEHTALHFAEQQFGRLSSGHVTEIPTGHIIWVKRDPSSWVCHAGNEDVRRLIYQLTATSASLPEMAKFRISTHTFSL